MLAAAASPSLCVLCPSTASFFSCAWFSPVFYRNVLYRFGAQEQ